MLLSYSSRLLAAVSPNFISTNHLVDTLNKVIDSAWGDNPGLLSTAERATRTRALNFCDYISLADSGSATTIDQQIGTDLGRACRLESAVAGTIIKAVERGCSPHLIQPIEAYLAAVGGVDLAEINHRILS